MKNILLSISLLLLASCNNNKTVTGQVLDLFGKPIKGAEIATLCTKYTTTTDASGNYTLSYSPADTTAVVIFKKSDSTYLYSIAKYDLLRDSNAQCQESIIARFPRSIKRGEVVVLGENGYKMLPPARVNAILKVEGDFAPVSGDEYFATRRLLDKSGNEFGQLILISMAGKQIFEDFVLGVPRYSDIKLETVAIGESFIVYKIAKTKSWKSKYIFGYISNTTGSLDRNNCFGIEF